MTKNLRQHRLSPIGGELDKIAAFLFCDLFQLGKRHRDLVLGIDQQIVLSEEAGEQRPVPVLIGDLPNEAIGIHRAVRLHQIAERARVRPQPVA